MRSLFLLLLLAVLGTSAMADVLIPLRTIRAQEIVTRSETDAFLAAAGARPRIVAEAQLSASICELVAGGVGLAIVEPVTAAIFARAGRVISRPLTPEQPFRYDLLTPTTRAPSRPATRFLEFVEARFTALLEP